MNEVEKAELYVLFALFVEYHIQSNGYVDLEDLYERYNLKFPRAWLASSVGDWETAGWVDVSLSHDGTAAILNSARYNAVLKRLLSWLDASSLTVDAKKEEIFSDRSPASDIPMINGWKWFTYAAQPQAEKSENHSIPAADRLVPLNHNEPDYALVKMGISEIAEAIRSTNDLPVDAEERSRLLASLVSASQLWEAAQLKIIQIRVGVLMAIEDAGRVLVGTVKAVAIAVTVDAIKSIVKNHAGFDLDKL